ncbi:MAG: carbohydrate ABC transporter permease [Clostridia bacterium]|nr:carbohydrate ABC transporter permease [Clostridia bacterium]
MKNKIYFFDYINFCLVGLVALLTLYPFLNVFAVSFSNETEILNNPLMIWPSSWNPGAYEETLAKPELWSSYANTIFITAVTTGLALMIYLLTAYVLSRKELRGKAGIMTFFIIPMMFGGGLIPTFYLIKTLGLYDSIWAMVFVALFATYNMTLMKNFMESIPDSLVEAARIDGASEAFILFKIIVPLSKAIIATVGMFVAVGQWNAFAANLYYVPDKTKWGLALFLREVIMGASIQKKVTGAGDDVGELEETIQPINFQYASLIITVAPILLAYPFIQKYFVKGMMVGSVKE